MQQTVGMIPAVFTGSHSLSTYPSLSPEQPPQVGLLAPDAFSNPEHIIFGLKGCLASSLCYIAYTSLAWPGISTAVTTCLLTALSTVGASRQKQVLRFTGAIGGGLVGIAAQVFILPSLDSIVGFTLLFIAFTTVAAWIASSGPRLSYFGVQIAVAFYLINLQEFKFQSSLMVARDRVLGILLGLVMMWLVFDQLWGAPAAVQMRKAFISMLRSLAQLAREPLSRDLRVAIERSYSLRETINTGFNKVRSLADGVLFEFGPARQKDLALRSRILDWQPLLRTLFVTRVALLKYRLRLPGFELPEQVYLGQQEFDESLAMTLDGIADRLQGQARHEPERMKDAFERLEQKVQTSASAEPQGAFYLHLQTFLPLVHRIEDLVISLDKEM
jgi:multidrug resistance protein MdtO